MQDHQQGAGFTREDFDFEALYQGKSPLDGIEGPPGDLGEPQPAVVALERGGQLRGEILDAIWTDRRGRVRVPVWQLHALRR